jgi:hypothetical protein
VDEEFSQLQAADIAPRDNDTAQRAIIPAILLVGVVKSIETQAVDEILQPGMEGALHNFRRPARNDIASAVLPDELAGATGRQQEDGQSNELRHANPPLRGNSFPLIPPWLFQPFDSP